MPINTYPGKKLLFLFIGILLATASYGTTYYVSTTGDDASGDGSSARSWRTLRYAVTRVAANQNHIIQLSGGTFVESGLIQVPPGVSISGAGISSTILKASSSFYYYPGTPGYATDKFLLSLSAGSPVAGNQTLSNFSIDGDQKKLHGGIFVQNRSAVTIQYVNIQNTNFTAIWLWDVKDSKIFNVNLKDCSWGSSAYSVGALNVGNLDRVDIDHLTIDEGTGYGIKAIGPNVNNLNQLKIHDSHISVNPVGLWNGGSAPNIAIELWLVVPVGCEIYNTYVDNTISLVNNTLGSTGVQTIRVHDVFFDMETRSGGSGYGLELTLHDAEVDHNYFLKGSEAIANWDSPMQNWFIHHNTFYAIQGTWPGDIVRSQWSGLHNVKLYNNTIEFTGSQTSNVIGLYGGTSENLDIRNNLFIDANSSYSFYPNSLIHMESGAVLNTLQVKNNWFDRLPVGSVAGSYSGNLSGNPGISRAGNKPSPYYVPNLGSPVIDKGLNVGMAYLGGAPDMGAYEYASTNNLPVVAITSPTNLTSFPSGSSIPISSTASDADGTIAKVEFFNGGSKLGEDLTSPYSFQWVNPPAGSYSLSAKATDNQGDITTSSLVSITVNTNQSPTTSITSPLNLATYSSGTSVNITANAADTDGTISKVEFFNGALKLGEDLTSPYSFQWVTPPSGTYSLTSRATDNQNGITSSSIVSITITNQNQSPSTNITSPQNLAIFTAGKAINIAATATDTDGTISKVEFFLGTTKLGEDLTSPYNLSWSNPTAASYLLTCKATDNNGASTTSSPVSIMVNANVLPAVNITSPIAQANFITDATVNIAATASDTDGSINKVEFFNGAVKLGEDLSAPFTYSWMFVPYGNYTLTAKATDNVGGTSISAAVQIAVTNPNQPPIISITSPDNLATFIVGNSIIVRASAIDNDGSISKVEFFNGATKLGEDLTGPFDFTWIAPISGTFLITAKATDNNGSVTTSAGISVVVNNPNSPPVTSITSPLNQAQFLTGTSILITAIAGDIDGPLSRVEFYNGTQKIGEDLSSPYTFVWTILKTGNYVLTTKAWDPQGATGTSSPVNISVKNPNQRPSVRITKPSTLMSFTQGSSITIQADATDPDGTITKVEFFDGATKIGEDDSSPYTMDWNSSVTGNYLLTSKATDNSNEVTLSESVSVSILQAGVITGDEGNPHAEHGRLLIFPNPAREKFTARYFSASAVRARLDFFSTSAISVRYREVDLEAGENNINLETENLPNGIYLISIARPDGSKSSAKLLIAR